MLDDSAAAGGAVGGILRTYGPTLLVAFATFLVGVVVGMMFAF